MTPPLPSPDPLPLLLSDASGVPFYRQVEDQLAELIRSGRLRTGAPLPSVRALAAQLKVSVITTRRAYSDLEQQGLVEARRGQGTFVSARGDAAAELRARELGLAQFEQAITKARQMGVSPDQLRAALRRLVPPHGGKQDD